MGEDELRSQLQRSRTAESQAKEDLKKVNAQFQHIIEGRIAVEEQLQQFALRLILSQLIGFSTVRGLHVSNIAVSRWQARVLDQKFRDHILGIRKSVGLTETSTAQLSTDFGALNTALRKMQAHKDAMLQEKSEQVLILNDKYTQAERQHAELKETIFKAQSREEQLSGVGDQLQLKLDEAIRTHRAQQTELKNTIAEMSTSGELERAAAEAKITKAQQELLACAARVEYEQDAVANLQASLESQRKAYDQERIDSSAKLEEIRINFNAKLEKFKSDRDAAWQQRDELSETVAQMQAAQQEAASVAAAELDERDNRIASLEGQLSEARSRGAQLKETLGAAKSHEKEREGVVAEAVGRAEAAEELVDIMREVKMELKRELSDTQAQARTDTQRHEVAQAAQRREHNQRIAELEQAALVSRSEEITMQKMLKRATEDNNKLEEQLTELGENLSASQKSLPVRAELKRKEEMIRAAFNRKLEAEELKRRALEELIQELREEMTAADAKFATAQEEKEVELAAMRKGQSERKLELKKAKDAHTKVSRELDVTREELEAKIAALTRSKSLLETDLRRAHGELDAAQLSDSWASATRPQELGLMSALRNELDQRDSELKEAEEQIKALQQEARKAGKSTDERVVQLTSQLEQQAAQNEISEGMWRSKERQMQAAINQLSGSSPPTNNSSPYAKHMNPLRGSNSTPPSTPDSASSKARPGNPFQDDESALLTERLRTQEEAYQALQKVLDAQAGDETSAVTALLREREAELQAAHVALHRAKGELVALHGQMETERAEHTAGNGVLMAQLQAQLQKLSQAGDKMLGLTATQSNLQAELDQLKEGKRVAEDRLSKARAEIKVLQTQLAGAEEEHGSYVKNAKQRLSEAKKESDGLRSKVQQDALVLETASASIQGREGEVADLNRKFLDARKRLGEMEVQKCSAQDRAGKLDDRIAELIASEAQLQQQLEKAECELECHARQREEEVEGLKGALEMAGDGEFKLAVQRLTEENKLLQQEVHEEEMTLRNMSQTMLEVEDNQERVRAIVMLMRMPSGGTFRDLFLGSLSSMLMDKVDAWRSNLVYYTLVKERQHRVDFDQEVAKRVQEVRALQQQHRKTKSKLRFQPDTNGVYEL